MVVTRRALLTAAGPRRRDRAHRHGAHRHGPRRRHRRRHHDRPGHLGGLGHLLAWWANAFGDRDDFADLFFTTESVTYNGASLPGLA
ncbi:hypothetical protein K7G98_10925 [Saccharothrix sp. MB29]|nr:hypothetical protein [Saccharothrix sp. MB29]